MSQVLVTEQYLEDIADAIRSKNGSVSTYTPAQMANAISAISGGGASYPGFNAIYNGDFSGFTVSVSGYLYNDYEDLTNVKKILNTYTTNPIETKTITVDKNTAESSLSDFVELFIVGVEYKGNITQTIIDDIGLTLLGDFHNTGAATGNALTDSVNNYSGIILNGIYRTQTGSNYNTSSIYFPIELNKQYWAGMKDRNNSYRCYVTFTDDQTVSLTGNKQVIIYGIP